MQIVQISPKKLESIAFQTNQVYEALEFALNRATLFDAAYAVTAFESARNSLIEQVPLLYDIALLSKNDEGINNLAPYIFQQIIGSEIASAFKTHIWMPTQRSVETTLLVSDLINTIQSNKSYGASAEVTRKIAQAHNFSEPFEVIKQIRNNELDIYTIK